MYVQDQFLWDISDPCASPELFASHMVKELGLDTALAGHVAWHIRDQVHRSKKKNKGKGA